MIKTKIYSPVQIACGAFFGGPGAMVFALKKNFDALDNKAGSKNTMVFGSLFIVVLFLVLPFLPESFPNYVLPIAYTISARQIAEKNQMTKQAISDSSQYGFRSNWNVVGISIGFLLAFLVLFVVWMLGLAALGIVKLK
jgi:hypothetical protein